MAPPPENIFAVTHANRYHLLKTCLSQWTEDFVKRVSVLSLADMSGTRDCLLSLSRGVGPELACTGLEFEQLGSRYTILQTLIHYLYHFPAMLENLNAVDVQQVDFGTMLLGSRDLQAARDAVCTAVWNSFDADDKWERSEEGALAIERFGSAMERRLEICKNDGVIRGDGDSLYDGEDGMRFAAKRIEDLYNTIFNAATESAVIATGGDTWVDFGESAVRHT